MKKQMKTGLDMDKALGKVARIDLLRNKKLKTDEPLAEKDEVKQAEERQRKQSKGR